MTTCDILQGNILDLAPQVLAARQGFVHCIVCSPPYFGLRDYSTDPQVWDGDQNCDHNWELFTKKGTSGGTASAKVQTKGTENFQIVPDKEQATCTKCGAWRGELGQEPSPDDFVRHLVQIFEALKPLLHESGTLWVNLGDSYAGNRGYQVASVKSGKKHGDGQVGQSNNKVPTGMKSKDMMGVPWTFALAMRKAGWYLRSDIIWAKRNPMPESVTDRPTKAHEYIFLFSKSERYFFDHIGAREATTSGPSDIKKMVQGLGRIGGKHKDLDDPLQAADKHSNIGQKRGVGDPAGRNMRSVQWVEPPDDFLRWIRQQPETDILLARYEREVLGAVTSVFDIPTAPYAGAHFATWPPRLAERMLRAGTSEKGVCPACWEPWRRVLAPGLTAHDGDSESDYPEGTSAARLSLLRQAARERGEEYTSFRETVGWEPGCVCADSNGPLSPVPATVLDPFTGSGTTLMVARALGRNGLGMELNPEYVALAHKRLQMPMDWEDAVTSTPDITDLPLFSQF